MIRKYIDNGLVMMYHRAIQITIVKVSYPRACGDASISNVLVAKHEDLSSDPFHIPKMLEAASYSCNSCAGEAETNKF